MSELGEDQRSNKTAGSGLLTDADGEVFDLTEWYQYRDLKYLVLQGDRINKIELLLRKIERHLSVISGEDINDREIMDNE